MTPAIRLSHADGEIHPVDFAPRPLAMQIEQAVIGAVFLDSAALSIAREAGLLAVDFADPAAAAVYRAMQRLESRNEPIDPLTVSDELDSHGELIAIGGKEYIGFLLDVVPTAANVAYHASVVVREAKSRGLAERFEEEARRLRSGAGDPGAVALRVQPVLAALVGDMGVGHHRLLTDVELNSLPEPSPLIDGMLFRGQLVAVVGRFGTYKTFLLLDWALSIALGLEWNGRRVRQGNVVYVAAEGASGLRRRVAAWKADKGYQDSLPIHFLPTRLDVCDPAAVALLLREIRALKIVPTAVFIDTVARNMSGDENSGEAMKLFVAGCDQIKTATGATVILAHHTGWGAEKRSRGSTELPGALDTEIVLERDDTTVKLINTKQKDAAEFAPITLEASPIGDSLVLRTLVPTRAELTRNELRALMTVQQSDGLSSTAWMEAIPLAKGSYDNARRRLLDLAYVRLVKSKYTITASGADVLRTKYNAGTSQVQTAQASEVQEYSALLESAVLVRASEDGQ